MAIDTLDLSSLEASGKKEAGCVVGESESIRGGPQLRLKFEE